MADKPARALLFISEGVEQIKSRMFAGESERLRSGVRQCGREQYEDKGNAD